jgi:hypothetical protein
MTSVVQRTESARRLNAAGSAAAALMAIALVLGLHLLRSELEPASHRLSEYALGSWGWLMTSAFLSAATGVWLLRRALPASAHLRPARALLAVAAVGFAVSALVPTDPLRPEAVREAVHSAASAGALIASTAAALWTVTIGVEAIDWRRALGPARVAVTVAAVGALLSPLLHDGPWTGAMQRLSVAALFVWLLLVCRAAGRGGRSHGTRGSAR